jgi:hypothetical protein
MGRHCCLYYSLLPLIESRAGIIQVLKRITDTSALMRHEVTEFTTPQSETRSHTPGEDTTIQLKKVLVAIDGSLSSLRALSYADSIFARVYGTCYGPMMRKNQ